jgi:hypothetical protein
MKQLAFFMNPLCLSWKTISGLLDQIFNANHLIFTGYGISTLILGGGLYKVTCRPCNGTLMVVMQGLRVGKAPSEKATRGRALCD